MVIKTFIAEIPQSAEDSDYDKYKTAFGILDQKARECFGVKEHIYSVEDTFLTRIYGNSKDIVAIKRMVIAGDKR